MINISNFENEIKEVLATLEDTLIRKNKDYGNSFDESINEWGIVAGGVVRISDKFKRLKQLTDPKHEQQVNDEAIEDTVLDLAGYSVLLLRWLKENKQYIG